jgi:hypothetical protein
MGTKITCKACDVSKPLGEFYASNLRTCKECVRQRVRRNRASKVGYYRAYDAKRFQADPRVLERHKRYQATPGGKAAVRRIIQKYVEANPEKRAAHIKLGNAVRDGRVIKPAACQSCSQVPDARHKLHGHHEDYSKPLDVIWLCAACHRRLHESADQRQERA